MKNQTINQHYISQVEQRLNASNPQADPANQKIYCFTIKNREKNDIRLKSNQGSTIKNNLSINDLFSFDLAQDSNLRSNFEELFGEYESSIYSYTQNLIEKLKTKNTDIKSEIINIFCLKFLNFFRNPFSIKKVLSSLEPFVELLKNGSIENPDVNLILSGRKPQQEYLCSKLSITKNEYEQWLCCLYILLNRHATKVSQFELLVKSLFESKNTYKMVFVYTYDDAFCALSDRGFIDSLPEPHLSLDFNLHKNAFIRYTFGDIRELGMKFATDEQIDQFIKISAKQIQTLNFQHIHNDYDELIKYNQNAIFQSKEHVYCAGKNIITKT